MRKVFYSSWLDVVFVIIIYLLFSELSEYKAFGSWQSLLHFIWCGAPAVALYFIIRFIFHPSASIYFSSGLLLLIYFINIKKMALTGVPLSLSDISNFSNLSIVIKYVDYKVFVFLFIFFSLGIGILFKYPFGFQNKYWASAFFISLSLAPYSYALLGDNVVTNRFNYAMNKLDMAYLSWDWPLNVKKNGLYFHLLQTGVRKAPIKSTSIELGHLETFNRDKLSYHHSQPRKIIYILCESCWYDNTHFFDVFEPLSSLGFYPSRALSPLYGGGTANAEFEFLTGMPSYSSPLTGVIYQEYYDSFRNNAESLARSLGRDGYKTVALHNNTGGFWKRDIVYKKFGFSDYISLEKMNPIPVDISSNRKLWQWQTDDYVLYESALNVLSENKNDRVFLHMITMSGHGPYEYEHDGDHGEYRYKMQMHETISRIRSFVRQAEAIDPDTLFFIYGDHKPALNYYFYSQGVLQRSLFFKIGESDADFSFREKITPEDYGDVPIWIKYKNGSLVHEFLGKANGKPFFCVSNYLNAEITHTDLYSFSKIGDSDVCNNRDYNYSLMASSIPSEMYSVMLF